MPAKKTICTSCDTRIALVTEESVEILPCPECGQPHKVSELGIHAVPDREDRHERLREWEEEML